ncbi:MobA/MobL family protein, partial [Bacillus thuringiensis]|uniref:MobA/MobL family protein n=1 Tax=Bacillus thuringiensis TaxID=1428 RepID=UPI00164320C7
LKDPHNLWNELDFLHKQCNAQLPPPLIFPLPLQLSQQQQTQILLQHSQQSFLHQRILPHISIHPQHPHNPHPHLLLTM